ncbi:MAG: hypothetical protein GTO49_00745 [Anaerolineae bacterium]|nr:hypothetical protein [Anaerolineae bacterium]
MIFGIVPVLAHLLNKAGPMPYHAINEIVGHQEARLGPSPTVPKVPPPDQQRNCHPAEEQEYLQPSPCTCTKNHCCQEQFYPCGQAEKSTTQGQELDGLGLENLAKELASTLMSDLIWLKPESPV